MSSVVTDLSAPGVGGITERVYGTPVPFTLAGSGTNASTALYLVHGFTGSPSEFRRLAYYLNDHGYTVNAILLPGHGTTPEDMIRTRAADWWGAVREGYAAMEREGYRRIIPVGHSMGGLLALMLAMEAKVDGVVTVSAPIHLGSRRVALAPVLQYFIKYVEKKRPPGFNPAANESRAYDKTPVPCVASFRKLLLQVKKLLHRVEAPIFIAQGELDRTALPHSAGYIYGNVASLRKEMKLYPGSGHNVLLGKDREQVFEDIRRFIERLEG